jgi:GNAT superfamily N-acetyltransferase
MDSSAWPAIETRALTADDWPVIRDLRLRSLEDAPEAFTSSHERESAFDEATWRDRASTCQWFAAFDDGGDTIGVAGGVAGWSGDAARRELVAMWVARPHRRRGVGTALLARVAEWARGEGAAILELGVMVGNERARAAYRRMGLHPTGRTMPVWNDPTKEIEFMERALDDPATASGAV